MGGGTLQIRGNNNQPLLTAITFTVEEHYKLGVTTSPIFALKLGQMVEEHYKLETNDR